MTENRWPMQARGPPKNENKLPQTPGTLIAVSGGELHLYGLQYLGLGEVERRLLATLQQDEWSIQSDR
jgi:hypothetical protein